MSERWYAHATRMERVFHEMERASGIPLRQWDDASDDEKEYSRMMVGVLLFVVDDKIEEAHRRVLKSLRDHGWTPGDFSAAEKQHPLLLSGFWDPSSATVKMKMQIAVMRAARDQLLLKERPRRRHIVKMVMDAVEDFRARRHGPLLPGPAWNVNPSDVPGPTQ